MHKIPLEPLSAARTTTAVVFTLKGTAPEDIAPRLIDRRTARQQLAGVFVGEKNEKRLVHPVGSSARTVMVVGLGEAKTLTMAGLRACVGDVCKYANTLKISSLGFVAEGAWCASLSSRNVVYAIAESALLALYTFDRYKTKRKAVKQYVTSLSILVSNKRDRILAASVQAALIAADATNFARTLINEPPNVMVPKTCAERIAAEAHAWGIHTEVLDTRRLKQLGMGGLLAVGQGSCHEPVLLVLRYEGVQTAAKQKTICIVGKGICFDAGGLSLKPPASMMHMKYDMAGGAVCAGAMIAAARLALPQQIVGIIPLAENIPDGGAYRPGDVVTTLSGQTVEVLNTDAEGRIILADALAYAKRFNPDVLIDIATLTGAARICLGDKAAALMGTNQTLVDALIRAGQETGEQVWQMPLWDEYQDDLKSDIADVKNIGFKDAGTIVGGKFLSNFVPPRVSWAHIDIAAVSWEDEGKPCVPKGASGFGVRLLLQYLKAEA